ncbi:Na(+)/drug antiporter [Kingella potus]|uniref:Multidrug-efflux transporter n=1 Tax=Kingella potus TaxID=265175 RepID=A0A377R348_9NEIS|nr:MATE family efflux transporter [Kingella potus]STR00741.1 Na(+)/drug antiporter [Kingella potus]
MLLDLTRYSPAVFAGEAKKIAVLAWPMMLAQIAAVGLGFVDTVMAGGAGKADLAAVALGSAAFATVFITWIGIMAALNPVVAQLHGAGKTRETGEAGRQGLWFGLLLGVAGMLLLLAAVPPFLWYLDLPQRVEAMLAQYLWFTAPAMPALMLYRALHAYTTSLGRTKAVMWVSWAGLLLNVPLNYVFVYGKLGMPALGGAGCGLATLLVCWFEAAVLWLYVKRAAFFRRFGLAGGFSKPDAAMLGQLWRLGWPSGFSYFLEASLFTSIMFLIAKFGEDYVAAQQVVISLTGIIYMIPQALGAAVTVRVGFALGRRQKRRARYISGVGVASGLVLAVCTMLLILLLRRPLAAMYTSDAAVLALAAQVLLFAALFQLFDFTQCIASYALRGYKITKAPMLVHGAAFWGLGLLPGWLLANFAALNIFGFWTALVFSLAAAAVLLLWLLERHSKAALSD